MANYVFFGITSVDFFGMFNNESEIITKPSLFEYPKLFVQNWIRATNGFASLTMSTVFNF